MIIVLVEVDAAVELIIICPVMDDNELLVCRPGNFVRAGALAGFLVFIASAVSSKSKIFSLFDEKARSVVSYALSKSSWDWISHDVPILKLYDDDKDDELQNINWIFC